MGGNHCFLLSTFYLSLLITACLTYFIFLIFQVSSRIFTRFYSQQEFTVSQYIYFSFKNMLLSQTFSFFYKIKFYNIILMASAPKVVNLLFIDLITARKFKLESLQSFMSYLVSSVSTRTMPNIKSSLPQAILNIPNIGS